MPEAGGQWVAVYLGEQTCTMGSRWQMELKRLESEWAVTSSRFFIRFEWGGSGMPITEGRDTTGRVCEADDDFGGHLVCCIHWAGRRGNLQLGRQVRSGLGWSGKFGVLCIQLILESLWMDERTQGGISSQCSGYNCG